MVDQTVRSSGIEQNMDDREGRKERKKIERERSAKWEGEGRLRASPFLFIFLDLIIIIFNY